MKENDLLKKIRLNVEIEAMKKGFNLSSLSIKLGKNDKYLSNKFNKNNTITVATLYEVAAILECEPSLFLPSIKDI